MRTTLVAFISIYLLLDGDGREDGLEVEPKCSSDADARDDASARVARHGGGVDAERSCHVGSAHEGGVGHGFGVWLSFVTPWMGSIEFWKLDDPA